MYELRMIDSVRTLAKGCVSKKIFPKHSKMSGDFDDISLNLGNDAPTSTYNFFLNILRNRVLIIQN